MPASRDNSKAALKASGVKPPRRWTAELVLKEIRKLHRRGIPLSRVWNIDRSLYSAAKTHLGSWTAALATLGLTTKAKRTWTKEQVREAIRDRQRRGLSLTSVWRDDRPLYSTAQRLFGSWTKALLAVNVVRPRQQRWTKQRVIREIRDRRRRGLPLTDMSRRYPKLYSAAYRRFGTWLQAVEAAGLPVSHQRKWSREETLEELRAAHRSGIRNIRRADQALVGAIWRYFGGMENARRAAGLKRPPKRWSREILVETIQDLHVRGEVKITAPWRRDRALALAAKDYFGNWANALVAAGILREDEKPQPKPSWTKQSVIQAIRERHRRGLPLTNMRNLDPSLNHAAIKYFGGWCNAVLAAGIEPEAKRHWTREGVVRAIQDRARTGLPINSIWIESLGLYYGARKHFGCWKEAIKAAGVSNVRRCHGKEKMVAKARAR